MASSWFHFLGLRFFSIAVLAVASAAVSLDAAWDISEPLHDAIYSPTATINGSGGAPNSTTFTIKVVINGVIENSGGDTSSPDGTWVHDLPAPPPPDPNGWTVTTDAHYEVWSGGTKQAWETIIID